MGLKTEFSQLAKKDLNWMSSNGVRADNILSTRIRLARNISGYRFPGNSDNQELENSRDLITKACLESPFFRNASVYLVTGLENIEKRLLLERHIISHDLAFASEASAVIIDPREQLSVMINEEDHIRLQYLSPALNLFDAWDVINKVDDSIDEKLEFAYDQEIGYLTACPTNIGTGLRASVQMHLPSISYINGLPALMENINKMGMVVRGLYGEGTRIMGNMLQISNQVTLGNSEQMIIDKLNRIVSKVSEREDKIRAGLITDYGKKIKDMVYRSRGLLTNAYSISFEETMNLISNIRLGVVMEIIDTDLEVINSLLIKCQPSHIQHIEGLKMDADERDIKRAELIRSILK